MTASLGALKANANDAACAGLQRTFEAVSNARGALRVNNRFATVGAHVAPKFARRKATSQVVRRRVDRAGANVEVRRGVHRVSDPFHARTRAKSVELIRKRTAAVVGPVQSVDKKRKQRKGLRRKSPVSWPWIVMYRRGIVWRVVHRIHRSSTGVSAMPPEPHDDEPDRDAQERPPRDVRVPKREHHGE